MSKPIQSFAVFILLLVTFPTARAGIHYVNVDNTSAVAPYTNWATAAKNIQDAVDVAMVGDEVVVTNGVYEMGGRTVEGRRSTNRVTVTSRITVRSVNGPSVTIIRGYQVPGTTNGSAAIRCVYLNDRAMLAGFTLTNGATSLVGNGWDFEGGGVQCESVAVVSNCVIVGNSAGYGGGTMNGTIINSKIIGNVADSGGGAYGGDLQNCALIGNTAWGLGGGGGAWLAQVSNCTLTGNRSAKGGGGGVRNCWLTNSIIYHNSGPVGTENYASDFPTATYCCLRPLASGPGNFDIDPQLADSFRLSAISPCRGAGSDVAQGRDIDGEPWAHPPSIGCDEYRMTNSTGPLTVTVSAGATNVNHGYPAEFQAQVTGDRNAVRWEFGDGTVEGNTLAVFHRWLVAGDYTVVVRVFNDDFPAGVSASIVVHVFDEVHYVSVDSPNPVPPFDSWATAARTIQDAVDAVAALGARVLVTNGIYATGGRALNGLEFSRVAADKAVHLRSVNGPAVTAIRGDSTARGVALPDNSSLIGFTVTNGYTSGRGGGVWCASSSVVSNCVVAGNVSPGQGGGIYRGTVYSSILTGNSASGGGGADSSTLYNCFLTGNSAGTGGGARLSALTHCTVSLNSGGGVFDVRATNCIVYYNALYNYHASGMAPNVFDHTCTTPLITGNGNIADDPQLASASHLSAGSPCRGAGALLPWGGLDIDGEPFNSPPSMGCDEYHDSPLIGPLTVSIQTTQTVAAPGYVFSLVGRISGPARASRWEFGDGTGVSNQVQVSHVWTDGTYPVVLRAYNDGFTDGVSATVTVQVVTHYVALDSLNPTPPYTSWATAARNIQDAVDAASELNPLVLVSNGVYETGGRLADRNLSLLTNRVVIKTNVLVRSVNGPEVTTIRGYQVPGTTNGDSAIRCVYLSNGGTLSGFTIVNGATRAGFLNGSDFIGGGVRCASSDVTLTNCVLRGNVAFDAGGGVNGAGRLLQCTLVGNRARRGGGLAFDLSSGASALLVDRCIVAYNSAIDSGGGSGGGVYVAGMNNCLVVSNWADGMGGGVYLGGVFTNCTVTRNAAGLFAGGVLGLTCYSSIIYDNTAPSEANYTLRNPLPVYNSCTTPLVASPEAELHNFTNAPLFVDPASGNFRLQFASPCIDAGLNSTAQGDSDLDGSARIYGVAVDVGAYEFQPPAAYHDWLAHYGLPTDGTADRLDSDLDHASNWQEWFAGTSPIDSGSLLRLFAPTFHKDGISITWQSVTGRVYSVERSTNAQTFEVLQRALNGQAGTMTLVDPEPSTARGVLYRVGAQ